MIADLLRNRTQLEVTNHDPGTSKVIVEAMLAELSGSQDGGGTKEAGCPPEAGGRKQAAFAADAIASVTLGDDQNFMPASR